MQAFKIGINNQYYIGDNVILEPIANALASLMGNCYVRSRFPEVFDNHPTVIGVPWEQPTKGVHWLDLGNSIRSIEEEEGQPTIWKTLSSKLKSTETKPVKMQRLLPGKLDRMYKEAGLENHPRKAPRLYLSGDEVNWGKNVVELLESPRIGIIPSSRHGIKGWPYMDKLAAELVRAGNSVLTISEDELTGINIPGVIHISNRGLREIMAILVQLDAVIGVDTGPMHLAGALGTNLVVIGYDVYEHLYEPYPNCEYISAKIHQLGLKAISVADVLNAASDFGVRTPKVFNARKMRPRTWNDIAVVVLEGLGGTVTLTDHAKKIHEKYGEPVVAVIRKYPELFRNNPHIKSTRCVGHIDIHECMTLMGKEYHRVAAIKTGIGRWYENGKPIINSQFSGLNEIYDNYPNGLNAIERYRMNLIQTANMTLGLDYKDIQIAATAFAPHELELPDEYLVVSNGVDIWHQGLEQTKSWPQEHWNELPGLLDIPIVQVGTGYDTRIPGTVDLRGKTSILQLLTVLDDAAGIICTEGGLMHLGVAVGNPNVFVMRGPTRGNFFGYPEMTRIDSHVCEYCYWDTLEWFKKCPKGIDAVCMQSITPTRVAHMVRSKIENLAEVNTHTPIQLGRSMEQLTGYSTAAGV